MRDLPIDGCKAPNPEERPQCNPFGTRFLVDESRVFEHNAWDDVEWPEEMQQKALEIVKNQKENKLGEEKAAELLGQPERQWDAFYRTQSNKFFKDRQWIIKEFPELDPRHSRNEEKSKISVLEVGCGVGNTAFPILNEIPDDGKFFLFSSDYSQEAVNVLKANDKYDSRRMQAFRWDITEEIPTDPENPSNFPQKGQLDYVICVYILSAIHPGKIKIALKNLTDLLKPGGMILMKDYGRYDLTQLRFKKDRFIEDNLYCRGDGTLVYFFDLDELNGLMEEAGLKKLRAHVDKRLIVNRETKVKMYRRWIQNKKTLLRLTCETLKYRPVFDEILKDQDGLALLSDPAVKHNVNLAYVLLYEYLVGPGLNRASPKLKGAVMKRAKQLKDLERQLSEENRGIDSVKNSEEQDTVQIPRYARINTLKWTNEEALKSLEGEKWTVVRMDSESKFATRAGNLKTDEVLIDPDVENLLVFKTSSNFHEYWMVKEKYLILQDKASCLPAFLLNPPLGSQVFDCCAAPGMKTSHLAAILGNQGKIWAMDRSEERVETMRQLLEESKVEIATVFHGDFLKAEVEDKKFSKVKYAIVDPPCSGSGIVKRKDELTGGKEKNQARLEKLKNLQAMILKHALKFPKLKKAVYSTCSIHEEENEQVVEEVLSDPYIAEQFQLAEDVLPNWKYRGLENYEFGQKCLRASPKNTLTNGFFVAVFERKT